MEPPKGTLQRGDVLYAEVKREVLNDGDVCRADRSKTRTFPLPFNPTASARSFQLWIEYVILSPARRAARVIQQ